MTPQQRKAHADYLRLLLKEDIVSPLDSIYLYGSVSKVDPEPFEAEGMVFDEDSDYDFAVPYERRLELELASRRDWRRLPDLDYQDDFTVAIYEGSLGGSKVQLSLRQAYNHFVTAWDAITPEFYWKFLNKRSPTFIGKEGVQLYLNQFYRLLEGYWNKPSQSPYLQVLNVPVRNRESIIGLGF